MKFVKPCLLGLAVFALSATAQAATVYSEGFDNLATSGWILTNNSTSAGNSWYQGVPEYFASQSGAAGSYAVADFLSSNAVNGTISNWLISPEITLGTATTLSFYARTDDVAGFNDTLKVYFNAGSASSTASFTSLLATITASTAGWTQYTIALPSAATGRIAFEYAVGDALTANVIGIDSVSVSAVPEPATYGLMGLGIAGLIAVRRRKQD